MAEFITNTKNEENTSVKQYKKRLAKLEKRLENINNRISNLQDEKRKIQTEISHCMDEQILFIIKSANLSIEEIADGIKLVQSIQRAGYKSDELAGLSKDEIVELTASESLDESLDNEGIFMEEFLNE